MMRLHDYKKVRIIETTKSDDLGHLEFSMPDNIQFKVQDSVRVLAKPTRISATPRFTYGQGKITAIDGMKVKIRLPQIVSDEEFTFSVEIPPSVIKKSRLERIKDKLLLR